MNEQPEPVNVSRIPRQQSAPPFGGSGSTVPLVVYILYLLCYFVYLPPIIGVVLAYTCRTGSTPLLTEHYRFQIRTFWIGLVYLVIAVAPALTIILTPLSVLLLSLAVIWIIVRCVRGIVSLQRQEPPQNLNTWLY